MKTLSATETTLSRPNLTWRWYISSKVLIIQKSPNRMEASFFKW
jgi:hypothetical protein